MEKVISKGIIMQYYIELTLLPGVEIPLYFLWEKLYQQVHLALVEQQDEQGKVAIGAAFPGYDDKQFQLGCKLRLFAKTKEELTALDLEKWLARLLDYVHLSTIRQVPEQFAYAIFKRLQPKTKGGNERLARRKAKRQGISYNEALAIISKRKEKSSKAPFIHVKSLSSDERYRLIIDRIPARESCFAGFSTYGLSPVSTVPVF